VVTRLLFGVQQSPHRKICVALAWVVAVLGVAVGIVQGWTMGVPVVLVGLVAVAILARQTANRYQKHETSAQLNRVTTDRDDEALRQLVAHQPHDPNVSLAKVSGQFDAAEIQGVIAQVRAS
jgi:fatty acid desaturase